MWQATVAILSRLKWFMKIFSAISKLIGWITPQGIHMLYKLIRIKGKADIEVNEVTFSDESDAGFKATINLTVTSNNPDTLTSVKTEIINKPPVNFN
jgi:hypothetical protein